MRKRVAKSEATLALLDTFQEPHLEWKAWVIIVFDVCFFVSYLMKSSVIYAAILFTHVSKIWDNDLTEYQVYHKLTDL